MFPATGEELSSFRKARPIDERNAPFMQLDQIDEGIELETQVETCRFAGMP